MPKVSEFQLQHQSFQRIFTTDFRSSCHPNNCHSEGLLGWWQQRSSGGSSSGLEEHLTAAGELRGAQPASPDWDLILWKEQWRCKWWWWPWWKRRMKRKQRGKKGEGLKRIVPTLSCKWETFYSTIASSSNYNWDSGQKHQPAMGSPFLCYQTVSIIPALEEIFNKGQFLWE